MAEPCQTKRSTRRDEQYKQKLIHRLNRMEGQIRGLKKMVEEDAYCNDILVQSSAVRAALNAFNSQLVSQHLTHCVKNDLMNGDVGSAQELAATLEKLLK